MGRRDALRVGVGMIPRGEVGMVVAQIGLRMGVMAEAVYGIIVFMSVATTLIAPPLLKLAFRGEEAADGRRRGHDPARVARRFPATIIERDQVRSLPLRARRPLTASSTATLSAKSDGGLFGDRAPTGVTHPLADVKLLHPVRARQNPGRRPEL